jgi:diguanylate cyclase (GGDEF)-like protein
MRNSNINEAYGVGPATSPMRRVAPLAIALTLSALLVWSGAFDKARPWLLAASGLHADELLSVLALLLTGILIHHFLNRQHLLGEVLRRAAEERDARALALHDPLTGLLNRRGMADVAERHLSGKRRHALLLCDLNGFKQINDIYGHRTGDEVLRLFAARLSELCLPGGDINVIRLGGDEFVLLVSTHRDEFEPKAIAREILRSISKPIQACNQAVQLATSIGVAIGTDGQTLDTLLEMADDAMYEAKRTGLPIRVARRDAAQPGETTRRKFEQQLDTRSPDQTLYAAAIGINRLNDIRRALGYGLGSKLVRELTHRLGMLEEDFGFERLSSNVLGVAFKAVDGEAAGAVLDRLRARLEGPVMLAGTTVEIRLTIGLSEAGPASAIRDLTEQAQAALEEAWRTGAAMMVFDEGEQAAASDNIGLMADMRSAVRAGALEVHYQPKLRAGTGEIEGMEALVRWTHPALGQIPPARFVPIAEKTGDIRALTDWVLDRVILDREALIARGHNQPIYVNVSADLVGDEDFALHLLERLRGLDGGIGIEITETAVLSNPDRALLHLRRLADEGIKIAIDDYGAGLSSLSYLKQLPATELKLDMMFITKLSTSHRDPMIVRSTIELAHGLGLLVTAEGVEDEDAVALLRVMGCDLLQGYLIAKPMPLPSLARFLDDHDPAAFGNQTPNFADMFKPHFAQVA